MGIVIYGRPEFKTGDYVWIKDKYAVYDHSWLVDGYIGATQQYVLVYGDVLLTVPPEEMEYR